MAKHTITISDEDGGLSISMASTGPATSLAGMTALGMIELARSFAVRRGDCNCPQCQVRRAEASIPPGTTIH
ncbi:MAG: hypothetical protein Q7J46_14375 [Pseudomonas sp.]|nr:hypothetical protein [Pseudomonas sp.]